MSLRRLGPAQWEELIQSYIDGVSLDEWAARFQVHQSTIPRHTRHRRAHRLEPGQSEEAARLDLARQFLTELSEPFGVATDTMVRALRRLGLRDAGGEAGLSWQDDRSRSEVQPSSEDTDRVWAGMEVVTGGQRSKSPGQGTASEDHHYSRPGDLERLIRPLFGGGNCGSTPTTVIDLSPDAA